MSYRESAAQTGATATERGFGALARGLAALARRVQRIEASNRGLPPGLRFDTDIEDDGVYVVIEDVRTGNRERIAGPL